MSPAPCAWQARARLATIYGDEALTVVLPNPMTNHPSFGSFKCFLGVGDYDFYMAKSGYTFETLTGVQGHGTMADQDASAVAITGGSIAGISSLNAAGLNVSGSATFGGLVTGSAGFYRGNSTGNDQYALYTDINTAGGTNRRALSCVGTALSYLGGALGVRAEAFATSGITLGVPNGVYGLVTFPTDSANAAAVEFRNQAFASVGLISTTATTTTYGTTSDARLKDAVEPLTGALDVVRALNPVAFRWKADDSAGRGFLAHEVQDVIPDGVIMGAKDAVDAEGQVVPQMIDYSKLVPYLIGAVKELTQQVEALTAQLAGAGA